jgi:hypothetical protein
MSAQGGTVTGRTPVQLPIRPIAVLLAIVTAAAIGTTAVWLDDRDAGVEGEASMPVQRLYPGGFVQVEGEASMPVQRLYPDAFAGPTDDGQTVVFDGRRRKW